MVLRISKLLHGGLMQWLDAVAAFGYNHNHIHLTILQFK